ncbi:MAG TPA: DUF433 domain-containing protein [Gemmatimonadales bacterium]|nr:DUF433 domain-containing protein [Gemmatimonadales bacterium]
MQWLGGNITLRKARLLACAIFRHAPYHPNGQTMWELVPNYRWFSSYLLPYTPLNERRSVEKVMEEHPFRKLTAHEVVELTERAADGIVGALDWDYARSSWARWHAEPDTWDSMAPEYAGAHLRYSIASSLEDMVSDAARRVLGVCKVLRDVEINHEFGPCVCDLIREMFPDPYETREIDRDWITTDVRGIALHIYHSREFELTPVLADALMDAGCDHEAMILHCRVPRRHVRGCWVIDWILEKDSVRSIPGHVSETTTEGATREEILKCYPSLRSEHIDAAIEYAEWRREVDAAREVAHGKGIDQAAIDRAVEKARYGR